MDFGIISKSCKKGVSPSTDRYVGTCARFILFLQTYAPFHDGSFCNLTMIAVSIRASEDGDDDEAISGSDGDSRPSSPVLKKVSPWQLLQWILLEGVTQNYTLLPLLALILLLAT